MIEDTARFGKQNAGFRGGLQPAENAIEQSELELVLGMPKDRGDRRLRDVESLCGAGDRSGLHNGVKNLDLTKIHVSNAGLPKTGPGLWRPQHLLLEGGAQYVDI
jgi:hypothetical protein